MRQIVRFACLACLAMMAVIAGDIAQAEVSDPWWDREFSPRQSQNRQAPVRATPSVPNVPKARPSLPPGTKSLAGETVLNTIPMNVSIPGKVIVFFIAPQQFATYENGKMMVHKGAFLQGPISSGSPGHATPITDPKGGPHIVGLRQVDYESNTYPEPDGGASMPHAQFFRNDGIAMHAGYIDMRSSARRLNHGLSHGCVRLLPAHAKILYELNADRSMQVIVVHDVKDLWFNWELGYFAKPS